jgi:hypothetical protein
MENLPGYAMRALAAALIHGFHDLSSSACNAAVRCASLGIGIGRWYGVRQSVP